MPQTGQNYKNHLRWFPPFHFFVVPVLLINVIVAVRNAWTSPSTGTGFACLVAAALFALAFVARLGAISVQDRLICLEMRLRLREILPQDLQARVKELSRDHLVALRFAGDTEMAGLVRQVLGGQLRTKRDIKTKITDWQADYLRA